MSFEQSVIVPLELYEKYFPKYNLPSEMNPEKNTVSHAQKKSKKYLIKKHVKRCTKDIDNSFEWLIYDGKQKKK